MKTSLRLLLLAVFAVLFVGPKVKMSGVAAEIVMSRHANSFVGILLYIVYAKAVSKKLNNDIRVK